MLLGNGCLLTFRMSVFAMYWLAHSEEPKTVVTIFEYGLIDSQGSFSMHEREICNALHHLLSDEIRKGESQECLIMREAGMNILEGLGNFSLGTLFSINCWFNMPSEIIIAKILIDGRAEVSAVYLT